jgi:hypothetical protein
MSPSVAIKTFLFPVSTQDQICKLEAIVKKHFKNYRSSPYEIEEFTQTWIYFEQWWFSKTDPVIGFSALKMFSYIAPGLANTKNLNF